MTDELSRDVPGMDTNEQDRMGQGGMDAPLDPDGAERSQPAADDSPWLREGTDAPDAADIESPDEQR